MTSRPPTNRADRASRASQPHGARRSPTGRRPACGKAGCPDPLLHCHEAAVRHDDGTVECLDGGCDLPIEAHAVILSCPEVASCADCHEEVPASLAA